MVHVAMERSRCECHDEGLRYIHPVGMIEHVQNYKGVFPLRVCRENDLLLKSNDQATIFASSCNRCQAGYFLRSCLPFRLVGSRCRYR